MSQYAQRAAYLLVLSRFDLAEAEARKRLAGDPHDPEAHAVMAYCRLQQCKFSEALDEARRAFLRAPYWAYPHYLIGLIHRGEGRLKEAEAAQREAMRLSPRDADYCAALAVVLGRQKKWHEALTVADHGLEIDPRHMDCLHYRAWALDRLGREDEAHAMIDLALRLHPDNAYAHAGKGQALIARNDWSGAKKHFREALRIDPNLTKAEKCLRSINWKSFWNLGRSRGPSARQEKENKKKIQFAAVVLAVFVVLTNSGPLSCNNSSRSQHRYRSSEQIPQSLTVQPSLPSTTGHGRMPPSAYPFTDLRAVPRRTDGLQPPTVAASSLGQQGLVDGSFHSAQTGACALLKLAFEDAQDARKER